MAKGGFVGGLFGNKWVRVSIYSVLVLLIVWVLYILAKKFIDMIGSMSPEEEKKKNIDDIQVENNEYADTPLSDAEAEAIADAAWQAMRGGWTGLGTTCSTLFAQIDPWRDDPNALRKIYKAYDVRDGYTLFETYIDELSDHCTNGCDYGFTLYPCDVPYDCRCNGRDLTELGCMRWYWQNSGMGGF